MEELAAKADVKARARDKADEVKAKAQGKAIEAKAQGAGQGHRGQGQGPEHGHRGVGRVKQSEFLQRRWPLAAAAAGVALVSAIVVWRRRKK